MFEAQYPMLGGDVILTCQNRDCAHRWLWQVDVVQALYRDGGEALCPNCGTADVIPPTNAIPCGGQVAVNDARAA